MKITRTFPILKTYKNRVVKNGRFTGHHQAENPILKSIGFRMDGVG